MPFPTLPETLLRALAERGYAEPTPVQAAVLDVDDPARDLLVSAQTGSGKTVAYGLALGPDLLGGADRLGPPGAPAALVIAPTRELALQVQQELGWLWEHAGARVAACVGGMDIRREQRRLAEGAHIVVGTPGRLRDHLERGHLDLSALRAVVLDEADEMLDLGFREELEAILDATPAARRTLLFSATLPRAIVALARRYQRDALPIAMTTESRQHGDIEYRAMPVAPQDSDRAVVNVLRFFEARAAIVFCATREAVRSLHESLTARGFAAVALSGELGQGERNRAIQALRDGRARVCVATDVAARGLDLPDLGLVIHADLPRAPEALLHRSGRTGRAGRKGTSVLLVPFNRRRQAERLLAAANVAAAWSPPPAAEAIRAGDRARLAEAIVAADEADLAEARLLLAERSPEAIAAALVRLHRQSLPAPEDLAPVPARPERQERPARAPERPGFQGAAGFRGNNGRRHQADPRWLIPVLCRRGLITREVIGRIDIADRQTRFEIAEHAVEHFSDAIRRPDAQDRSVRIETAEPDYVPAPRRHRPARPDAPRRAAFRG